MKSVLEITKTYGDKAQKQLPMDGLFLRIWQLYLGSKMSQRDFPKLRLTEGHSLVIVFIIYLDPLPALSSKCLPACEFPDFLLYPFDPTLKSSLWYPLGPTTLSNNSEAIRVTNEVLVLLHSLSDTFFSKFP